VHAFECCKGPELAPPDADIATCLAGQQNKIPYTVQDVKTLIK
jgi:hypothetical protein